MSEAMRNRLFELDKILAEQGSAVQLAGDIYAAHMQLFNVAVSNKDKVAQEQHRLTMHTMLDMILDTRITVTSMNEERSDLVMKLWHER